MLFHRQSLSKKERRKLGNNRGQGERELLDPFRRQDSEGRTDIRCACPIGLREKKGKAGEGGATGACPWDGAGGWQAHSCVVL